MAINIGDNFKYKGKEPNFDRDKFMTLTEMSSVSDTDMDEGHISYCVETGEHYKFSSANELDSLTGRFRLLVQVGKKDKNTVDGDGNKITEPELMGEVFNDINNIATGICSHAEGASKATGICSHAEGSSEATGDYSHSEGASKAIGDYSHSEGSRSTATGDYSHAEGASTAIGICSHAEGASTAVNYCQFTAGHFNFDQRYEYGGSGQLEGNTSPNKYNPNNAIFAIGNGKGNVPDYPTQALFSDALRMLGNGTIWIGGIGGFEGTNPEATNSLQAVLKDILSRLQALEKP